MRKMYRLVEVDDDGVIHFSTPWYSSRDNLLASYDEVFINLFRDIARDEDDYPWMLLKAKTDIDWEDETETYYGKCIRLEETEFVEDA